jgi:NAD(P)-dependent dehydrogenase (short-subunit alcohol dehydrogenase family)
MKEFEGKVAVITGGGSGIGRTCSDKASFVTGHSMMVDGGFTAR